MALEGMTDESLPREAMRAEYLDAETEANLARAWRMAGAAEQARSVLEEALEQDPDGLWSAWEGELREMHAGEVSLRE